VSILEPSAREIPPAQTPIGPLTPVAASQPSTDGLPASLKGPLDQKLADPRLTPEQKEQALRVISALLEKDPNNEAVLGKFLKAGGVALLAKLDGVPIELQQELVSRVSCNKLFFETLDRFLDKFNSSGRNETDLRAFLRSVDVLQNASQVSRLMSLGGIASVVQAAGVPSVSLGGGTVSTAGGNSRQVTMASPALTTYSPSPLVGDLFAQSNSTSKSTPQALIAEALIDFAKSCLERTRKEAGEQEGGTTGIYSFGSPSTLRDLQQALQVVSARYGGLGDVARALSKLPGIQTAYKADIVGSNITAEEIEASLRALIISWKGQMPTADQLLAPTGPTPPTTQPPTVRPQQSGPPAGSPANSVLPGTNSHPA
jgi:hypothetical protein